MHTYHYFRSESRPLLHGFTDESAGARLPAEEGPWRHVRAIDPADGWPGNLDLSAVEAGVKVNGFFLHEHEGELVFDKIATRAQDFR
jgi:hypothetical protein